RLDHKGYDEAPLAKRGAASVRAEHHEITMGAAEGESAFAAWAAGMDQPLGGPSGLPTWLRAKEASSFVPGVLTGGGGDELFAGQPPSRGHRPAALAGALPEPLAAFARAVARRLRPRDRHVSLPHLVEHFLGVRGLSPFERHLAWFGTARAGEALALL